MKCLYHELNVNNSWVEGAGGYYTLELAISVSDQGLVNCLDPEPCCSNWDMHVQEEDESPLPEPAPSPNSCFKCGH